VEAGHIQYVASGLYQAAEKRSLKLEFRTENSEGKPNLAEFCTSEF